MFGLHDIYTFYFNLMVYFVLPAVAFRKILISRYVFYTLFIMFLVDGELEIIGCRLKNE